MDGLRVRHAAVHMQCCTLFFYIDQSTFTVQTDENISLRHRGLVRSYSYKYSEYYDKMGKDKLRSHLRSISSTILECVESTEIKFNS